MIQRFYQYLFLFKEYVILVLLISISLVLLVVNDNAQIRQIRSLTVGTIGVSSRRFLSSRTCPHFSGKMNSSVK